jgi:putative ATP-binding cassette transporter
MIVLSGIAALFSGIINAGLIATINLLVLPSYAITGQAVLIFTGLCVLRLLTSITAHLILIRTSQRAVRDLRLTICNRILSAPLRDIEQIGANRLLAAMSEDIQRLAQVVVNVPYFLINVIIVIACMGYLGWLSPMLCLITLAGLALGTTTYILPILYANRILVKARSVEDALYRHFKAMLDGIKELKQSPNRTQQFLTGELLPTADRVRMLNERGIAIYATVANWNRLLFFVYVGGIILLARLVPALAGEVVLSAIVLVVLYMMAPIEAISNALPHLAKANVSLRNIESLIGRLGQGWYRPSPPPPQALPSDQPLGCLTMSGVTYRYANGDSVGKFGLGPIDLQLKAGTVTFLFGCNGSGKTTLAKVLSGLYEPQSGSLHLKGRAVSADWHDAYRARVAAIWADGHVFDTLEDARTSGVEGAVAQMLEAFSLHHTVQLSDGRLSTVDVSTGQKKRLALIHALAQDRSIYIFDEWAANQDPEFTVIFYQEILPTLRRRGKIVLAITHDTQFFGIADHVYRLVDGQLQPVDVADGPVTDDLAIPSVGPILDHL